MYQNIKELCNFATTNKLALWEVICQNEMKLTDCDQQRIFEGMSTRLSIMKDSSEKALNMPCDTIGSLIDGFSKKQNDYASTTTLCGSLLNKVMARAMSASEVNASMGRICAAPTAGACGILPAVLFTVGENLKKTETDLIKALIVASGIGAVIVKNATVSGAEGGCQAECGVAAAMAIMEATDLVHGDIEALFTATEETGMIGAFGLKAGFLKGDILLNLDSETEGELYVGCAGGTDANITFNFTRQAAPSKGYKAAIIEIKGLKGGHSGIQIECQRGNANKLLFHFIRTAQKSMELLLCSVDGGSLRNAIPRESNAVVMVKNEDFNALTAAIACYEKQIIKEYASIEDSISISVNPCDAPSTTIPAATTKSIVNAIIGCPDGVIKMSTSMKGLVQTSTNLARVLSDNDTVKIQCLLRSSMNSEKVTLGDSLSAVFELAGADVELSGSYDGWSPNMDSPILKAMHMSYDQLYGKEPIITGIHAGLECGIIGTNYPYLDMISFGPTICFPHSPDEKVEIASVAKFYEFLLHTLKNTPIK